MVYEFLFVSIAICFKQQATGKRAGLPRVTFVYFVCVVLFKRLDMLCCTKQ